MRQNDYGLDLLDFFILQQLKEADFAIFSVSEAIELLRQDILEVIKKENRGCSPEDIGRLSKEKRGADSWLAIHASF